MLQVNRYQVRVLGEHFSIRPAGSDQPGDDETIVGFVTTRWVEAPTPQRAALASFDLVRAELASQSMGPASNECPPTLTATGIWEMESFDGLPVPGKGFVFFGDGRRTLSDRFRQGLKEIWYRVSRTRPWTYSEPF